MRVRITQNPLDWTGMRIGIEGFDIGTIHNAKIREDGRYKLEGTIWLFDKESVKHFKEEK